MDEPFKPPLSISKPATGASFPAEKSQLLKSQSFRRLSSSNGSPRESNMSGLLKWNSFTSVERQRSLPKEVSFQILEPDDSEGPSQRLTRKHSLRDQEISGAVASPRGLSRGSHKLTLT